jgi:phosphate transport system substrate-binding protein
MVALAVFSAARDVRAETRAVTLKGSDTMVILAQRWIEQYRRSRPDAVIQLNGGGSATGIAALVNGTTDLAASSIPLDAAAAARAETKSGRRLRRIPVALDVLAIYVHPSNPVDALSLGQLHDILTGKLLSWRELGGPDAPIAVYGRENSSGSYRLIRDVVMGADDFADGIESLPGTGTVADNVARDLGGIGYGGIAYARRVKPLRIRKTDDSPAVAGSADTARSGEYGLTRTLYLYGFEPLRAETAAFVAWTLGEEGQQVVADVGYFPLGR